VPKKDFWEHNPALNAWTQRTNVGGTLSWSAGSLEIENKSYVGPGTGNTANSTKLDFWQYTPEQ
jgi:hypothetical protein